MHDTQTAANVRLFFLTLTDQQQAQHAVKVLARDLPEALELAAAQLGPVELRGHGSRCVSDLQPGGDGTICGGGQLLPSPYDQLLRPGALS